MKSIYTIIGSALILLLIGVACSQKEDPIVPLAIEKFDTKPILMAPSGSYSFNVNQEVSWRVTKSSGGSLTFTQGTASNALGGKYQAPATPGIYGVVVKGIRNPQDSIVVKVVVSSQFAVLDSLIRRGNYALVFRHGAANVGADTFADKATNWWKSCDATIARQLNPQGETESQKTGLVIKSLQLPVGRVFSSEYCRCLKTAELMSLGLPIVQHQDITYYVYDEANRYPKTMQLVSSQPTDGKVSILVTHAGFSGMVPANPVLQELQWGDAAVFKIVTGKEAQYVTTISVKNWLELAN